MTPASPVPDAADAPRPAQAPPPPDAAPPVDDTAPVDSAVRRRPILLTVAAALSGVVLTLVVLPPPQVFDSYYVWEAGRLWPNIPYDFPVLHHAMRLGTVLPARLAQMVFGLDQASVVAASAALIGVFTAGIYATGRALFNDRVGLIALALVIVSPFLTLVDGFTRFTTASTGSLYPDAPAGGEFALGVAALVVASRRRGRRQLGWLVAAGVCFGVAYLTREFVAFMFVAIPVFFVLLRIPWRRMVAPIVPMLAILGAELAINYAIYGDALARLHVAEEHGIRRAVPLTLWYVLGGYFNGMATHPLGWIFTLGLVLTVVGVLVFRDRRLILLLVWFVSLWLPLTLVGGLLDPYQPSLRVHLVRYWFPVLPAVTVGGVATVAMLVARIPTARAVWRRVAVGTIAALTALYFVTGVVVLGGVERDQNWREFRAWVATHPQYRTIVTDSRSVQAARFYTQSFFGHQFWKGQFRSIKYRSPTLPTEVIRGRPYLETVLGAQEHPDPAQGWRVLWRSTDGSLTVWQR
ncbi:MAG TPA: glycosyltransferase family 39 protein [Asanoa sp.]